MLLLTLKISIGALILAIGMNATIDDILHLWRRPLSLIKAIAAMYVVIPVVAVLMALAFDLPTRTELAFVILSICAGAPLLPKKLIKFGGDPDYVFSLIVTTSLLAIVTVPASLHILAGIIPVDATGVTPADVARVILMSFLVPLGIGMLLRLFFPKVVEKAGDFILHIASIAFGVCALAVLVAGFHLVFDVGMKSIVAFALFAAAAILTGHLLGGPAPSTRTALAIACTSRHVGLALLIAANAPGHHALSLVIAYLLASAVVSVLYIFWMKRLSGQP